MKLIGGGGLIGAILTTDDSTFGGGLKLFFETCRRTFSNTPQIKTKTKQKNNSTYFNEVLNSSKKLRVYCEPAIK